MDSLPDVAVTLADGTLLALRSLIGAPAVLYFYPKADTTGCTREAQDFSALQADFAAAGAAVIGISKDQTKAIERFAAKHGLTVQLASDESGAACEAFGVWGEKSMYGRTYMGIERASFLFDRDGRLMREWRKVRVAGHAQAVLDALTALG